MSDRSRKHPRVKKHLPPRPSHPLPSARLANLERALKDLGEAHDKNVQALTDCLYVVEARQWIIMRAMDDSVQGTLKCTGLGTVDWSVYEERYKTYVAEREAEETKDKPTSDLPEDAVVFGG